MLNKQSRTAYKGGPPAWGLGEEINLLTAKKENSFLPNVTLTSELRVTLKVGNFLTS
jgi:hypothetical protein